MEADKKKVEEDYQKLYDGIKDTLPEYMKEMVRFIYKAYEELDGYPAIFNINPFTYISSLPNDVDYDQFKKDVDDFMRKYTFTKHFGKFPKDIISNKRILESPPPRGYGRPLAQIESDYRIVNVSRWCTDHPENNDCQNIIAKIPEAKKLEVEEALQPVINPSTDPMTPFGAAMLLLLL